MLTEFDRLEQKLDEMQEKLLDTWQDSEERRQEFEEEVLEKLSNLSSPGSDYSISGVE